MFCLFQGFFADLCRTYTAHFKHVQTLNQTMPAIFNRFKFIGHQQKLVASMVGKSFPIDNHSFMGLGATLGSMISQFILW